MKFLITGAKGQLAREFLRVLQRAKSEEQVVKKRERRAKGKESLCSELIALDKDSFLLEWRGQGLAQDLSQFLGQDLKKITCVEV